MLTPSIRSIPVAPLSTRSARPTRSIQRDMLSPESVGSIAQDTGSSDQMVLSTCSVANGELIANSCLCRHATHRRDQIFQHGLRASVNRHPIFEQRNFPGSHLVRHCVPVAQKSPAATSKLQCLSSSKLVDAQVLEGCHSKVSPSWTWNRVPGIVQPRIYQVGWPDGWRTH